MISNRMLKVALRLAAAGCAAAALLHAVLGPMADRLLDPALPLQITQSATLDSQNRFYGTAFALHAAVLWLSSTDLARYTALLRLQLVIFFAAGLVRLVSCAVVGWPSPAVIALGAIELAAPPVLWAALARLQTTVPPRHIG